VKRSLNNREKVLGVLLLVAAVIAYKALTGDGIGFGPANEKPAEDRVFGEPPVVRMDLLAQNREGFDATGRNLFSYYVPPPPPKRYVAPAPPPPTQAVKRERPKPPPPPPPSQPQAPAPRFAYLGYLGPKDEKIAVFDGDDGVMLARVGDTVEDKFRLTEFKHESVMMAYTDEKWEGRTTELKLMGLR